MIDKRRHFDNQPKACATVAGKNPSLNCLCRCYISISHIATPHGHSLHRGAPGEGEAVMTKILPNRFVRGLAYS
ncbi:MAG: hypothetical protein ACREV5_04470, partial [Steroidobacter sp.]